jgi:hypothetical protein
MTDTTKNVSEEPPPYRVLSMDGGGIYGIFTAIMLRKLCERLPKFLDENHAALLAGTSAGAVNALLLAKHESPRDAILNHTLENLFKDDRTYGNRLNPVNGVLSLFGLTSWSGKADFYSGLEQHFGNMRMKDLKQRVLITAFDLWGTRDKQSPGQQRWKPKVFYNFPGEEPDRELYVKDVAYGAASPPTVRPVVNGITDGGFFADDPSINAITKIVSRGREYKSPLAGCYQRICATFLEATSGVVGFGHCLASEQCSRVTGLLRELQDLVRADHRTWDRDRSDLAKKLDSKIQDLERGHYLAKAEAANSAYTALLEKLDIGPVWARGGYGAAWYGTPASALYGTSGTASQDAPLFEAFGEGEWVKMRTNVQGVTDLVDWEVDFFTLLADVLDSTGLPPSFKTREVLQPKKLLDDLKRRNDQVRDLLARDNCTVEEAEVPLLHLGLIRKALYDHLEPSLAEQSLRHISVLSLGSAR